MRKDAKGCERKRKDAKGSEKTFLLVSRNEAKRKRNDFCFASFRFEAEKSKKRKWDTLPLSNGFGALLYVHCTVHCTAGYKVTTTVLL